MKNRKEKVIVFGGSGFLGSHVADALSDAGYGVTIFDLAASPYLREDQKMVTGDIMNIEEVKTAIKGHDYVYNFAGIADLDDATTKPLDTIQLNIVGSINIAEGCVAANVKRYIYASSIYVYSQKGGFYRCSKQATELYIEEYNRRHSLDYVILRYGTLYGPRSNQRNSIYRYLKQALESGTVVTTGSGEEVRDYVHVSDASRLSIEVLNEQYKNKHIIISGHHPLKFKELFLMLEEILGKKIEIVHADERNQEHYDYTPYSYAPKIGHKLTNHLYLDMGQGLLECLHYIQNELESTTR